MNRRGFLLGAGAVALAGRPSDRHGLVHRPGLEAGPGGHVPASGAVEVSGHLHSRYTHASMGWTISMPGNGQRPRAIVYCLYGKGGNHCMAFDRIGVPGVAASVGLSVAVAAVDGGPDSYWHRRADGSEALAMLLGEFVPLAPIFT